ncbi:MFS transporter [Streptomyces sp. NPDC058291]|uniref:MFS transporter n=1 Tax=Streptomyces sp. NPDC058291 TaxID=3346427 RepID=UPI0036E4A28B
MPSSDAPPARRDTDAPGRRGRLPAVLLMAGSRPLVLGAVLIAPVLPRTQDHFRGVPGSAALVPLVLTVHALSPAVLAPFAGALVDRLGRKRLLVAATVLYALFGTAPLGPSSLYAIVVSRVLVGVAEAAHARSGGRRRGRPRPGGHSAPARVHPQT